MKLRLVSALLALWSISAFATTYNTPVLDGRPLEYDATDLRGAYTGGGGSFGAGVWITNLYVTWDSTYLYVALQGAEANNKLVVMLDVDPGNGTGASATTNWTGLDPSYIKYNDVGWRASDSPGAKDFGLDYMIASEGFYNNILRIIYDDISPVDSNDVTVLFDHGNGSAPVGSPVDMAVQSDSTSNELKGIEARIPWSVIYGANTGRFGTVESGEIVPRGATIRLFANVHNNDPNSAYSADDAIPQQVSSNASYAAGLLTTDDYIDVPVDQDNDGIPDGTVADVNAPYLRMLQGATGRREVYVLLNEPVRQNTAEVAANWTVGGNTPSSATLVQTNAVMLQLGTDLPDPAALVKVQATGVEDVSGNSRAVYNYFNPSSGGISTSITVRFILETASGLGLNPGSTNFFLNGGALPLEWGYPPAKSAELSPLGGTLYYRDVVFPPGSPVEFRYKYSGVLTSTGTNTYEAIRLAEYADAARYLTFNTNASFMVVTDYLGAAAGPYRDPTTNTGYNALYIDANRGDAGVRQRTVIKFQLDLSSYSLVGVTNIAVKGSDPLRGFNADATGIGDFNYGGIRLYDDGTMGDLVANDGIYSRDWACSVDGADDAVEPDIPYSLVGGGYSTDPYLGTGWEDRRSPRSFIYKFYVSKDVELESQGANQECYIQGSPTNVVLPVFVWNNNALPPPPPENSPTISGIRYTNGAAQVLFTNLVSEAQHGLLISTNLRSAWLDYGTRASGAGGKWTGTVQGVGNSMEHYAVFSGPAKAPIGMYFEPDPLPATGGLLRVWYRQHGRDLAGKRNVGLTGNWNSWGNGLPMTFLGDGVWYYELPVTPSMGPQIEVKARTTDGAWESGDNTRAYLGQGRATWTPEQPVAGGTISITYDAAGGPLATETVVKVHLAYDESWWGLTSPAMTNVGGTGTVWELTAPVPTNASLSVNFVFKNNAENKWDSEGNPANGGRQYRVFVTPHPYP